MQVPRPIDVHVLVSCSFAHHHCIAIARRQWKTSSMYGTCSMCTYIYIALPWHRILGMENEWVASRWRRQGNMKFSYFNIVELQINASQRNLNDNSLCWLLLTLRLGKHLHPTANSSAPSLRTTNYWEIVTEIADVLRKWRKAQVPSRYGMEPSMCHRRTIACKRHNV